MKWSSSQQPWFLSAAVKKHQYAVVENSITLQFIQQRTRDDWNDGTPKTGRIRKFKLLKIIRSISKFKRNETETSKVLKNLQKKTDLPYIRLV
jgi:hypothetical protein